jgi:hypothetical protein
VKEGRGRSMIKSGCRKGAWRESSPRTQSHCHVQEGGCKGKRKMKKKDKNKGKSKARKRKKEK